jgi:5-oxoprolinase (ATP-hydrolysing)
LFMGGGQGASDGSDGKSGLLWPTSAANTSIELIESRTPILVLEKSFIPDSGGAGRHRGGLAQRVRIRKRVDDSLPMLVSVYPEGVHLEPAGLFGGQPGLPARGVVLGADGAVEHDCGTGELVTLRDTVQQVEIVLAGGSGFGSPKERDRSDIEQDLAMGWVTQQGAERDYGISAERPAATGDVRLQPLERES